ncbi:MAG: hypothetical protein AAGF11_38810 [Myxococcota bacterium]
MRVRPLVGGLVWATGCGNPISLDETTEGPPGLTTSLGTVSAPPVPGDASSQLDEGGSKLDLSVGPDIPSKPLPPGVCPPDCQFELSQGWTYDGPPGPAPDPEDRVLVIVGDSDESVTVAEQRQGAITLARLDGSGQELWTLPLALPCDPCHVTALGLHPTGDLLLAGYGEVEGDSAVALVARVELGEPEVLWTNAVSLPQSPDVVPRAGPLVVLDGDLLVQPVLQASALPGQEQLELLVYEASNGSLAYTDTITTGPATNGNIVPLAVDAGPAIIAVSRPVWSDDAVAVEGELMWLQAIGGTPVLAEPRPVPPLALAQTAGGRIVTLGQSQQGDQPTLHLHSGTLDAATEWSTTHQPQTDSAPLPAMTTSQGQTYVVTRLATGAPARETGTSIQLLRWSSDGSLVWQVALPISTDRVDRPLSLQLLPIPDSEPDLVLAGFVAGARHVERRGQGCSCV